MFISSLFSLRLLVLNKETQRVHQTLSLSLSLSSYPCRLRSLAMAFGLTALFRLCSHHLQADFALNCLKKHRTVIQTRIAYFIGIDMCYNITFLDPTVEIGDASRKLKNLSSQWASYQRSSLKSYDIRNKQSVRVWCEKSKAEVLASLFGQFDIDVLDFWWISSINCHFCLKRRDIRLIKFQESLTNSLLTERS